MRPDWSLMMNPAIVACPFSSLTRKVIGRVGAMLKRTNMSFRKPMSCEPCPTLKAILAERCPRSRE